MSTNEIVENNRLIAEFLGYKSYLYKNLPNKVHIQNDTIEHSLYLPDAIYHLSWDWLMPVVKKINDMFFDGGKGEELQSEICDWLISVNIVKTHSAVVAFINWFNQSKS